jgi:hypothetical protein
VPVPVGTAPTRIVHRRRDHRRREEHELTLIAADAIVPPARLLTIAKIFRALI